MEELFRFLKVAKFTMKVRREKFPRKHASQLFLNNQKLVELAVVMGKETHDCPASNVMDHVAGYALAIDCTARNLQIAAKNKGLPWSTAKGFDTFSPVSEFIPKESIPDTGNVDLWLKVNDKFRQQGNTKDMIFR